VTTRNTKAKTKAKAKARTQRPDQAAAATDAAPAELTAALREQVRALSHQAVPPKQIARRTGLPTAQVVEVLRDVMDAEYNGPEARAITGCWVNAGWSRGLDAPDEYLAMDRDVAAGYGADGLAVVTVARREPQGMLRVCQYLLDLFCLGVKDTTGPVVITPDSLDVLLSTFYRTFSNGYLEIAPALAAELVWGAVDFAAGLGFAPPPGSNWPDTRGHLDERPESTHIRFGRDGKPLYVNGPYDNADRVLATLRHSVGDEGFDTVLRLG
jgi:hypothetical protein